MEAFASRLVLVDTLFENNKAQIAGGATAANYVDLTVHGGSFSWNVANTSGGGAMMCHDCTAINSWDAVMHNNQAGGDGGAVQAAGSALEYVMFYGVHMSNNT